MLQSSQTPPMHAIARHADARAQYKPIPDDGDHSLLSPFSHVIT